MSNNEKDNLMNADSDRMQEEILQEGIRQIRAGMRTSPDPELFERISGIMDQADSHFSTGNNVDHVSPFTIRRSITKLGWSLTAAAAAIFAGIMVGNFYYTEASSAEKEAYKEEINMQSSDISGLSAELINYYNEDNP